MAGETLRGFIDICEGKTSAPWGVSVSPMFAETVLQTRKIFPDIEERIKKFVAVKTPNPIDPNNRYGKHDRQFTGPLVGFWHCHLRDDAILIYKLANHAIFLIAVVSHADIEGKRAQKMAKKLSVFESVLQDEKFWVNTATHEIELVYDYEEYGPVKDAIQDGYVMGEYSNDLNEFKLTASTVRTLTLAIRALLTNHSSVQGMSYQLLSGESGHMDYADMMRFRQAGRLTEGLSSNWNDLVNRALAEFDRQAPEIQKKLEYGSKFKKHTMTIPLGPRHQDSSLMGDNAVINITFWKWGEKPKSLDRLGGWANEDNRKGQWGNYRIEMIWSHDLRNTRRVLAHEITHIPQMEKNWIDIEAQQTNFRYQMWANERKLKPHERRGNTQYARQDALHHEYKSEHEAELVALFSILRDTQDYEYACRQMVEKFGRYMRYSKKEFLKKAVAFGVTPEQIHGLNVQIRRVLDNCRELAEQPQQGSYRNPPVFAMLGILSIANYCRMMGIDYDEIVKLALKTGVANIDARIETATGTSKAFLEKAKTFMVNRAKILLAGAVPRFYYHHDHNNTSMGDEAYHLVLKGIDGKGH